MDWKREYRDALLDTSIKPPNIRKIVKPHIPSELYKYGSFESEYWEKNIYKFILHLQKHLMVLLIVEQILIINRLLVNVNSEMN